ncbi:hypothetical protein DW1_1056 [Proteiniborus sp. DW1]|uniref:hypothetical protein n=1 Tax=Proteiniborus sp. DW1 TaxID=1889883 RepID=UPI00092DEBD1|nr:hypothetical protein [Proteiniborus sp. DW1]SCG82652.1 hypothetical protein DW1_1056 [Proteiniborus sp. DW1]
MQKKKIGVFTFAITLISLGILLLIRNFIEIDLKTAIGIAWPSIIILFGIEIIITKLVLSRNSEETKTYIDPLSAIILSIIIVITSIYSSFSFDRGFSFFSIVKSIDFGDFSNGVLNYKDVSTYKYDFTIESIGKEELEVINRFGDVEVIGDSVDNIEISAEIKINYNDKAYADELSKKIVKIDDKGSLTSIVSDFAGTKYDQSKAGNISISYYIRTPSHMRINIENEFGDTILKGLEKDVEINSRHGNIEVSDILGFVKLDNSFGSIDVTNIKGNVEIDNQHDEIYVENVEKDITIKCKFGDVEVEKVGGNLNLENEHANVDVEDIKGDLYIYGRFGNINVDNANKFIKVISKNGNISFKTEKLVEKGLEIENEFGNIDITVPSKQSGSFNVVAEFGEIENTLGLNVTEGITEQNINDFIDNTNIKFYIRSKNGNINLNTN